MFMVCIDELSNESFLVGKSSQDSHLSCLWPILWSFLSIDIETEDIASR